MPRFARIVRVFVGAILALVFLGFGDFVIHESFFPYFVESGTMTPNAKVEALNAPIFDNGEQNIFDGEMRICRFSRWNRHDTQLCFVAMGGLRNEIEIKDDIASVGNMKFVEANDLSPIEPFVKYRSAPQYVTDFYAQFQRRAYSGMLRYKLCYVIVAEDDKTVMFVVFEPARHHNSPN